MTYDGEATVGDQRQALEKFSELSLVPSRGIPGLDDFRVTCANGMEDRTEAVPLGRPYEVLFEMLVLSFVWRIRRAMDCERRR